MSGVSRALVLVASLAAGSWVGLGRPPVCDGATAWASRFARAARANDEPTSARLPPDRPAPAVDPAQIPDPRPFPRLNPEETTRRAWLLAEGPAHEEGDGRRLVTLTFDDGPFPETTPDILDLLAKHRVRAAFFWIGQYLDGEGDRAVTTRAVARRVVAAGHFVGNHTYDHARLTGMPRAEALAEIDRAQASIERLTGARPTLFRPPYGELEPRLGKSLAARGLDLVLWSIEAGDMTHGDPMSMFQSLRDQIEYAGGGVVLLHDIRTTTIPVLASLLDWLDAHRWDPSRPDQVGYEVVDLAAYMQATSRAPQPFTDRPALEHARGVAWNREHPRARAEAARAMTD
jgi:peptidoglycan/xylan/chitin deacetylase (PgdA/CDA1 family)